MARKTDKAYDKAQSKQTRAAAERYQRPDWGQEDPKVRAAYDQLVSRTGKKGGKR